MVMFDAYTQLIALTATILSYELGVLLFNLCRRSPIANPMLVAILCLSCALWLTDTNYQDYLDGATLLHFMLGPATVALAVPLYDQMHSLRGTWVAVLGGIGAGSITAAASVILIGYQLGASQLIILSLLPKSVTAPVAMGISERIGGLPALTAVLVILTGIVGAMTGSRILDLLRIKDPRARGLSFGVSAHGLGTVRAFQEGEIAGAFSGLAMGLNGVVTTILVPIIVRFI